MLLSGMDSLRKCRWPMVIAALAAAAAVQLCGAQGAQGAAKPGILDRMNAMIAGGKSAWTREQMAVMERVRDAALKDPYALNELRHLSDNIGPRLSGSPQAQQAVDYVAAEMRALEAEV